MRSEWLMGFMIIRSTLEIITKKRKKKMHDHLFLHKLHNFEKKKQYFFGKQRIFLTNDYTISRKKIQEIYSLKKKKEKEPKTA